MVELKSRLMLFEAADPALASSLFDKLSLDLPATLQDSCDAAFQAAEASIWTLEESGVAMTRTA